MERRRPPRRHFFSPPFPAVSPQSKLGVTVLPVSFENKHVKLSKYKLQAHYLDRSCCARPRGPAANRWTVWRQGLGGVGRGGAGLAGLKSVKRQFLLIWQNQCRQMQTIHSSGNLWILHWALTYITMTSKHNFRGHVFSLFPLPAVFLCSTLCPSLTRCCMGFIPSPQPPRGVEKPRLC